MGVVLIYIRIMLEQLPTRDDAESRRILKYCMIGMDRLSRTMSGLSILSLDGTLVGLLNIFRLEKDDSFDKLLFRMKDNWSKEGVDTYDHSMLEDYSLSSVLLSSPEFVRPSVVNIVSMISDSPPETFGSYDEMLAKKPFRQPFNIILSLLDRYLSDTGVVPAETVTFPFVLSIPGNDNRRRDNNSYSDMCIYTPDSLEPVNCHRFLMCDHEFFKTLFSSSWREDGDRDVLLEETEHSTVKLLIEAMYNPTVVIQTRLEFFKLLAIADKFRIDTIVNGCNLLLEKMLITSARTIPDSSLDMTQSKNYTETPLADNLTIDIDIDIEIMNDCEWFLNNTYITKSIIIWIVRNWYFWQPHLEHVLLPHFQAFKMFLK